MISLQRRGFLVKKKWAVFTIFTFTCIEFAQFVVLTALSATKLIFKGETRKKLSETGKKLGEIDESIT